MLTLRDNFTKGHWVITYFDGKIPNYHFSRTGVLNYKKPSNKGIPSAFDAKSWQNFQNTQVFIL
jgi:hypothetical protein